MTFEERLADLENKLNRIAVRLDQLPSASEFVALKRRVSQLPTLWQLIWLLMAFVPISVGLAFVLLRFALPRG